MNIDPNLFKALAGMGAGSTGEPGKTGAENPVEVLLQNSNLDPKMQLLLSMMQQQNGASEEGINDEDWDDTNSPTQKYSRSRTVAQKVRRAFHALQEEVDELSDMADVFGQALGACGVCFGGDTNCPECRGMGKPGFKQPDSVLYAELIQPAVDRMHQHTQTSTSARTPTNHDPEVG